MKKLLTLTTLLLLSFNVGAERPSENISMVMNGVRIVDLIPGDYTQGQMHSFSVDRPEFLPAPCPANRIVVTANPQAADEVFSMLAKAQAQQYPLAIVEYEYDLSYPADQHCHLTNIQRWHITDSDWSVHDLILIQNTIPRGWDGKTRNMAAVGCPNPWQSWRGVRWQADTPDGLLEGSMNKLSGDLCYGVGSDVYASYDANFYWPEAVVPWRICEFTTGECTEWMDLIRPEWPREATDPMTAN